MPVVTTVNPATRDEPARYPMGKPLAQAAAEVEKCATACDCYADNAGRILADEVVETSADRSWISYEPVGLVLAVLPWNFPLWQVVRFAAPALMAGNAALVEHSPNTSGTRSSGYGRELAEAGMREFVNVRTYWLSEQPADTAPTSE